MRQMHGTAGECDGDVGHQVEVDGRCCFDEREEHVVWSLEREQATGAGLREFTATSSARARRGVQLYVNLHRRPRSQVLTPGANGAIAATATRAQ